MVNGYGYAEPGRVVCDMLTKFEVTGRKLEVLQD